MRRADHRGAAALFAEAARLDPDRLAPACLEAEALRASGDGPAARARWRTALGWASPPSGALDLLGNRLLALKPDEEYLFLRYANRALRFYSLRIAGRETLTVTTTPSEASKSESETPQEEETKIPTTYLVGQVGLDGAIVESWIDKNGRIIKIRTNGGLIMLRSNAETIQKLWPEPMHSWETEQNK